MLHAAAMLTGLFLFWLALTQRGFGAVEMAIGFAAALACVVFAQRFGGVGRGFSRAPRLLILRLSRVGAVAHGAVRTLKAAISSDVALTPALVRVRSRVGGAGARAVLAELISAAPGEVAVEADAEGVLLHVLDEDAVDAAALGALEADVLAAVRQEEKA